MEILDIYDENRMFTGKTMNRDKGKIALKYGEYVIQVKCWILNKENKILLTQRRKDKYNGGMWEPTGGLAISGETSIEAIKRELFEEIGIKVEENSLKLIDSYRDDHFFRDVYLIKDNITLDSIKFNDGEVADAKYVTIHEFKEMLLNNEINSWNESFIQLYENVKNNNKNGVK